MSMEKTYSIKLSPEFANRETVSIDETPEYNYVTIVDGIITRVGVGSRYAGCGCDFTECTCVYKEKCVSDLAKQMEAEDAVEVMRALSYTNSVCRKKTGANPNLHFEWVSVEDDLPSDNRAVYVTALVDGNPVVSPNFHYCRLSWGDLDRAEWECPYGIAGIGRRSNFTVTHWMDYPQPAKAQPPQEG